MVLFTWGERMLVVNCVGIVDCENHCSWSEVDLSKYAQAIDCGLANFDGRHYGIQ